MTVKRYPAKETSIPEIQKFVQEIYKKAKFNKRTILEYELLAEEVLLKLIESSTDEAELFVTFDRKLGGNKLVFSCKGEAIDLEQADSDEFSVKIIADYSERISQTRRHGVNYISLSTKTASNVMSRQLIISAIFALLTGFLLSFLLDASKMQWVVEQIFGPLSMLFIKLLQCIAAPVAFLSLVTYIINYHESVEYDKGLKQVSLRFLFSSVIAVLIAFTVWRIAMLCAGEFRLFYGEVQIETTFNHFFGSSLSDIIIQIIPDNLSDIFTLTNPLPMLVFAIILGFAINSYSSKSNIRVRKGMNDLMDLLAHLLNMVFTLLPVFLYFAIVYSILFRILSGEIFKLFVVALVASLLIAIAFLLQYVFYTIQLCIVHISPVAFFKKYKDMLLENLKISSNIDALPYNLRTFRRKLGKKGNSPLVRSTLSLGTLMNMDGNCLIITISILIFNSLFGQALSTVIQIELMIIIILLGIGSPNQPGSFTIATIVLISFLGIDSSYASFIIIIEAAFCKLYSATNSYGDIVTVVIIADDELKKKKRKKRI